MAEEYLPEGFALKEADRVQEGSDASRRYRPQSGQRGWPLDGGADRRRGKALRRGGFSGETVKPERIRGEYYAGIRKKTEPDGGQDC